MIMIPNLRDAMDMNKLQSLLDGFYDDAGIPYQIGCLNKYTMNEKKLKAILKFLFYLNRIIRETDLKRVGQTIGNEFILCNVEENTSSRPQPLVLEKSNKDTYGQLEDYEKLKTEFLANISHELRTPVHVILSAVQMTKKILEDDDLTTDSKEKISKYTDMIQRNCYRLIRLVNNILDLTRIEANNLELHLQNRELVRCVKTITFEAADFIKSKGLEVIFETEVDEKIMAFDLELLERILLNLLSNAIKFSNPGDEITIKIWDKEERVFISVKDTGAGIAREKMDHIFDRFHQVDKSLSRPSEGSGIGLSLVKALVELQGGRIDVTSECEKGSEFIIELPVIVLQGEECPLSSDDSYIHEKVRIEFSDIYI